MRTRGKKTQVTHRSSEQTDHFPHQVCPDARQEQNLHVLITKVNALSDNYSSTPIPMKMGESED